MNETGKQANFRAVAQKQDLTSLIERLEKASGPDRELGARIICAVRGLQYVCHEGRGTDLNPHQIDICAEQDGSRFSFWSVDPTGSIDAALTLVPPTYTTGVHSDRPETFPTGWSIDQLCDSEFLAEITYFPTRNVEPLTLGEGYAISPAIALCIAALKARSAA